ncbi:hypothetical protein E0500_018920 [Streptomyces sp. KM273126]|uniref:hypothetical protein n=1 Tax=Streptomyces sp. KM273126 TaxID=2545247 RepID=UPI00103FDD79|nr:hypothetical protein [Streptomyces sp. KM273126]MBA2809414.1 hypothetical protein [Streptomyces sp. KM273126]
MTTARTDAALRELATTALQGDRVVHLQPVVSHSRVPRPPRRRRRHPGVLPHGGRRPKPSAGVRVLAGLTGFLSWVTAPLDFLGDLLLMPFRGLLWLCRSKEKRRREKGLNGGWDSAAGGLAIAVHVWGDRVLAVGERQVGLVYVGEREAELAWTVPREEVAGVELADWDTHDEQRATLRWHFRDGSWCDVVAQGAGWKYLVDALPVR